MRKTSDITNQTFGYFLVLSLNHINKHSDSMWNCLCKCGTLKIISRNALLTGNTISCGCSRRGEHNEQWTGFGDISGNFWYIIKHNALERKIKFDITIEEAWKQFELQNGKCYLSDIKLHFSETNAVHFIGGTTASLDRIDNEKGYIKSNIAWTHKDINFIKSTLSVKNLLYWCNLIVNPDKSDYELIVPKIERDSRWKGHGLINGNYWCKIKQGAVNRKIALEISIQDLWNQFLIQNGRCAITNIPLNFAEKYTYDLTSQTSSLDRIDSSKGYTIDNIQWVHKTVNMMKQTLSDLEFKDFCYKIHKFKHNIKNDQ